MVMSVTAMKYLHFLKSHLTYFSQLNVYIAGSPSRWRILQEDIHPVPIRRRRCLICRQSDHLSKTCPRKYRICIMCGVPGHLRFNCPQSKCLNVSGEYFVAIFSFNNNKFNKAQLK